MTVLLVITDYLGCRGDFPGLLLYRALQRKHQTYRSRSAHLARSDEAARYWQSSLHEINHNKHAGRVR